MDKHESGNVPQCQFFDPATWFCTARHAFHYEAHKPYCTRCIFFQKSTAGAGKDAAKKRGA